MTTLTVGLSVVCRRSVRPDLMKLVFLATRTCPTAFDQSGECLVTNGTSVSV